MNVKNIMSTELRYCTPDATLRHAAQLMAGCDCGAIPVVRELGDHTLPLGIITDRDIVCRAVAEGFDPNTARVADYMSTHLVKISNDASDEDCLDAMERAMVRRLLVVNSDGDLCGIVAQADVALRMEEYKAAELVREVSQPTFADSLG